MLSCVLVDRYVITIGPIGFEIFLSAILDIFLNAITIDRVVISLETVKGLIKANNNVNLFKTIG